MNKRTISFKIDGYTINLHRGKEETEEIKQRRMALFINCLCNHNLVCLIGRGVSGKSTILEAISYVLSPNWSIQINDR